MKHPDTLATTGRAHSRRRAGAIAALLGTLLASGAMAAKPLATIEECLETGTRLVSLPGVAGGSLSASECRGCKSLRLTFDARTRYFIGEEPVTYARLREAAAKGSLRLYVFYRPETRTLTRLRLVAVGNIK